MKIKRDEFEKACVPLIKFLKDNHNPHVKVLVDNEHAEMLEGVVNVCGGNYQNSLDIKSNS